jgi:hypothetical protein
LHFPFGVGFQQRISASSEEMTVTDFIAEVVGWVNRESMRFLFQVFLYLAAKDLSPEMGS